MTVKNTQQIAREKGWDGITHARWGARRTERPHSQIPGLGRVYMLFLTLLHEGSELRFEHGDPKGRRYLGPNYTFALWDRHRNKDLGHSGSLPIGLMSTFGLYS